MTLFAQVTMLTAGADPADNNVNGFAADGAVTGTSDFDDWVLAIKGFYDAARSHGPLLGLAQNGHIVKIYDIGLPQPNYPIYENTFNLAVAPGAIDMPREVSLCISYANTVLNTVPRARRRGRIYLSGFSEASNTSGRPIAAAYEELVDDYAAYVAAVNGIATLSAGVWSRTDGVVYPIDSVWADDEWDTQRRRGGKATTRYTVSV